MCVLVYLQSTAVLSWMVRLSRDCVARAARDRAATSWVLHRTSTSCGPTSPTGCCSTTRSRARRCCPAAPRRSRPCVRACARGGRPVGGARRRAPGCPAARCRSTDGVLIVRLAAEARPRGRPRQPARLRRAGRHQRRGLGRGRARLLLPARPVEPDRLLDRRQRGRELRRRALLQVRLHDELRLRARGRAARRRDGHARRQASSTRRATTCSARSSARRARSAIATKVWLRVDAGAGDGRDAGRVLRLHARRPARRSRRSCRPGVVPGRDRDDGRARDRGVRADGPRRLSGRPRRGAAGRARRRRARVRGALRRGRGDLRALRLRRRARGARRGRAPAVLEDAQGRVPGDGPHLAQLLRPGRRDPAHEAARGARARSTSSREEYGMQVANVFHAGDGNLHPLVCYDGAVEGEAERAEELSGRILDACLEAGGSITGEHGVGVDKKKHMPKMFDEPDLAAFQRLRCAFDPGGPRQPRQGDADAAAVRRGARALPAAPARGRRAGGAVLMATPRSRRAPGSPEEAAALLRALGEAGAPCASAAAARSSTGAAPATRWRSSSRPAGWTAIVEHNVGDFTAVLAGRRAARATRRRAFAADGPDARARPAAGARRRATIGGVVATDDSGPLRHRYGGVRDLVVGITVALSRRHARQGRRQGDQERRRLRPRQAVHRLATARSG